MHILAHGHLNNRRKANEVHLGPSSDPLDKAIGVHLRPCRDPLDDPRMSSHPLKAEPVTWLLPQKSRDQVLRLGGNVRWEPQVNLI